MKKIVEELGLGVEWRGFGFEYIKFETFTRYVSRDVE